MTTAKVAYLDEFPPHRAPSPTLARAAASTHACRVAHVVRRVLRNVRRVECNPSDPREVAVWQGTDPGHGRVRIALICDTE